MRSGWGERGFEEPAEAAVAGKGTVRDAAVDDSEGGSATLGLAPEVGPDFGLENDEHGRTERFEYATDEARIVEGREEQSIDLSAQFDFGELASSDGGARDVDRRQGIEIPEVLDERYGRENFAH